MSAGFDKITMSLCPACYKPVPAIIKCEDNGVFMHKECRNHGRFVSVVEKDPRWFALCQLANSPKIYDGYFIDVTDRCNIACKACYHRGAGEDRPIEDIVKDAQENVGLTPFMLTGGEPTMHPRLPEIVERLSEIGETWILSNGVKLADTDYLNSLCSRGLLVGRDLRIGLSIHPEANGADVSFLNLCRDRGLRLGSVQYTIDAIGQIDQATDLFTSYRDNISVMRIKSASNLWREKGVKSPLFVSDMLQYLERNGGVEILNDGPQKVSFATVLHKGLFLCLVSWYNVNNVDLNDIDCPPYYRAKDGVVRDFVHSCLVNEGIEEEVDGIRVRRAVANDIPEISYLWETFVLAEDAENTPNREAWAIQTAEGMKNPNYYLLIAEKGNKVIGFQDGVVSLDASVNRITIFGRHFYIMPEYRSGYAVHGLNSLTKRLGTLAGATDIIRPITPRLADYWQKKGCKVTNVLIRTGYV